MKPPAMFRLTGLSPAVFGETFVVIAVWKTSQRTWAAEVNTLSQRPQERLYWWGFERDTTGYPTELAPLDEATMEAEAVWLAETNLALGLKEWAKKLGRPEFADVPVKLERTQISPVTLWVQDVFPAMFSEMAQRTNCAVLRNYLRSVMSLEKSIRS